MSDLMRDEFEKAVVSMHVSHGVPPEDAAAFLEIGSNGYRSVSTKSAWWAWQASRDHLVIELPIPVDFPDGTGDYHQMIDPDDLIDAIHAAGVKTK